MVPSTVLKAVDKLFKEIMKSLKLFGRKTLHIGGDFRQTLPVVPQGTRAAFIKASLKFNEHRNRFKVLKLKNYVCSIDPDFCKCLAK